jgi:ABC-2 type transport system ATP-binding protein
LSIKSHSAIKITNLSKNYSSYRKSEGYAGSIKGFFKREHKEVPALKPLTLEIDPGMIVGLVGANGAGKTTLLKILSGLIYPSSGSAEVAGFSPWLRERDFLVKISILLGQKNQLWWDLAPIDSFRLISDIYDIDWIVAKKRFMELSELLNCVPMLETQLRRLSLGERMKMEIIGSLLHNPEIIFLDEPTIGLDVVAQASIREFLLEYVKLHKPTVVLTSHYMDDIARLAERLLIMTHGTIVYDGTVSGFIEKTGHKQQLTVVLTEPLKDPIDFLGKSFPEGEIKLSTTLEPKDVPFALQKIMSLYEVSEIKTESVDLEEVVRDFFMR